MSPPPVSRRWYGGWPSSPAIRNCDFKAVDVRRRLRDRLFAGGKLLGLPTVLAVLAKLVAERANRYPQDDRRVSAITAAMLHRVYDQVAFNLRDRLPDEGGNPESSACLAGRGVSSRRSTKVTCWLPHPNSSKLSCLPWITVGGRRGESLTASGASL
jgi:hypothetical protein